ncbi:MAG: NAD(P)-dependent oxidoreductase [Candidatus Aminicenantaceae bacterium]
MRRWKVLCNEDLKLKPDALQVVEVIADVDYIEARRDILLQCIDRYDAYYASAWVKADEEVLKRAHRLKVIATPSTGTDHIDRDYARQKEIDVIDIAEDYDILDTFSATAEMAWCLLLACMRHLPGAFEDAKKGMWSRQKFTGCQLLGKTLGILGYGRLGKMMAEIGKGFRMRVIACDKKKFNSPGLEQVDFDTLLSESDVLTIHIHLTEKNRGILSREAFRNMKQGVVIINTSRGALIDEEALLEALESGKVAAAGLDVIQGEWDHNLVDHPLIKYAREHDNLIITPHIGGATVESIIDARIYVAQKLAYYIKERMS